MLAWTLDRSDQPIPGDRRTEPRRRPAGVCDLVAAARARQRDTGSALLRAVETRAEARGLRRLAIGVLSGKDPAGAAYRRFGVHPDALGLITPLNQA